MLFSDCQSLHPLQNNVRRLSLSLSTVTTLLNCPKLSPSVSMKWTLNPSCFSPTQCLCLSPHAHTRIFSLLRERSKACSSTQALIFILSTVYFISMDAVQAIVALHHLERIVFRRILDMGTDVQLSKRIVSFWLWLEAEGYEDIVKRLCCHDDELLAHACAEAKVALASLNSDSLQSGSLGVIPITARLSGCRSSLFNISKNKDSVSKDISGLCNGVCSVIFKDILEEKGLKADNNNTCDESHDIKTTGQVVRKWFRPMGQGMNQQGGAAGLPGLSPINGPLLTRARSKLNPFAKEWNPWQERAPEEDRSLFITFSNGYPLSNFQLWQFFTT